MAVLRKVTACVTALAVGAATSMASRVAMAETVVVASDEEPSEVVGDGGKAVVQIRSTGDKVIVAKILGRTVAVGAGVVVAGVAYKDLCTSPCTLTLDPGLHELVVYEDGVSSAARKFDFRPGRYKLVADPGSSALESGGAWVTAFGIVTVLTGALFLVLFPETTEYDCSVDTSCPEKTVESDTHKLALPLLLGGAAGTGLGIWMYSAGHTSLEEESSAPAGPQDGTTISRMSEGDWANLPLGLSYRGTF